MKFRPVNWCSVALMHVLYSGVKKGLSLKAKLLIYWSI